MERNIPHDLIGGVLEKDGMQYLMLASKNFDSYIAIFLDDFHKPEIQEDLLNFIKRHVNKECRTTPAKDEKCSKNQEYAGTRN